jgi:hypothetical protein
MEVQVVTQPVILSSTSSGPAAGRPSSPKDAFSRAMRASRCSISSSWSSHVRSTSGSAMTARRAFCSFKRTSFAAVATCWISNGPSADSWAGVGVAAGGWAGVSRRRLRSLWRSGRMSNNDGGGIPGLAGAAGGRAGVAAPVGGCEALAEADAWGVGAADMFYEIEAQERMRRAGLVLSLPTRDDASVRRVGLQAGLLIGVGMRCATQGLTVSGLGRIAR